LKALGLYQLERRGNGGPAQRSIVSGSHLPTEALVNFDHFSMISPAMLIPVQAAHYNGMMSPAVTE
jgi:hypothetical protein